MSEQGQQPATTDAPGVRADGDYRTDGAFVGAAVLVSVLTAVSRVFGLARDLVLARIFGDTAVASSFAAAFAIPNLFRRLFGEGALAGSFIPEYAQQVKHDRELADRFASLAVALLVAATGVLTLVLELLFGLVLLLAPEDGDRVLFLHLVMVMLPYMPLVCIAAILGGMLQVHGRFVPAAAAPVLLNACIIGAALFTHLRTPGSDPVPVARAVAFAVLFAGLLQAAWALVVLRRYLRWRGSFAGAGGPARRMLSRFAPALIGLGTIQINAFIDMMIAMWPIWFGPTVGGVEYPLDESSNGILFFAQRLYQFPLGVFGIAIATAVFPALASVADEPRRFHGVLRRGLRLAFFIGLPAAVGLVLIRDDVIRMLYTGGPSAFSEAGAERAALVLLGYAPGVWAYSVNHVLIRAFYARGDTRTPMRIALRMVVLNLCLNLVLIWSLGEAGLAWSTTISAVVQCVLLTLALRRVTGERIIDGDTGRAGGGILIASLAMGVCVFGALALLDAPDWTGSTVRVLAACGVGLGVYVLGARLLRLPELGWLIRRR